MDDIKKVVRNYAEALFECIPDHKSRQLCIEQISAIAKAVESDGQLKIVMSSPVVGKEYKINLVKAIRSKLGLDYTAQDFLNLLIKNARMSLLSDIAEFLEHLLKEAENIKGVSIISAGKLMEEEKKQMQEYLEYDLKQKVCIKFTEDPSIIAGIIIRYDSVLLDYSIKGAMQTVKQIGKNIQWGGGYSEA